MAKPVIKFTAVPYQVGTGSETKTGLRPQLSAQDGIYDLPFCQEVVSEKRLQTSPDELLHEMRMVAEVASTKVAADGRPRGITKLIKWNRFAKGTLESTTSPWNETCKAEIRPQLLANATKIVDATFVNVNTGIGVKLNYIAWVGAQTVIDVIKIGKQIGAYGNHMEFIAGDTATLTVGGTAYPLTCVESDVAHAIFSWPAGLAPEAGTPADFTMLSRGGVEDGQVYTSKKTVTVLAGDAPTITTVHDGSPAPVNDKIGVGSAVIVEGQNLNGATMKLAYTDTEGAAKETTPATTYADGKLTAPASLWTTLDVDQTKPAKVTVTNAGGSAERTVAFREL